ncbi:MAG: MerC domain-containing protein [Acidobacteria bacterium]|nr:MerC domain-containing protein [Acidobacteriota bacterium]
MFWKRHLDKVGVGGSFVAAACCLGLPAAISILGAVGLGFLVNDAVLLPLLLVFLALTLAGLWFGYRVHRRTGALVLGGISAGVLFVSIFVSAPFAYTAVGGLAAASVLNVVLRRRCAPGCEV